MQYLNRTSAVLMFSIGILLGVSAAQTAPAGQTSGAQSQTATPQPAPPAQPQAAPPAQTGAGSQPAPAAGQANQAAMPAEAPRTPAELGMFVYPKNNQNPGQQKTDEAGCYSWAQQQTGIDPTAPAEPQKAEGGAPKGGAVKGAAKGAAAGAAIGGVAGDAGTGAGAGAVAGTMAGRRKQKKAEKQAEQQAQQQQQAASNERQDTFKKAMGTCLEAHNYSVK
jgi:hypothetical protein